MAGDVGFQGKLIGFIAAFVGSRLQWAGFRIWELARGGRGVLQRGKTGTSGRTGRRTGVQNFLALWKGNADPGYSNLQAGATKQSYGPKKILK